MAVVVKEEWRVVVGLNLDDDEFLVPMEDPLAFDDNCVKIKVEDDSGVAEIKTIIGESENELRSKELELQHEVVLNGVKFETEDTLENEAATRVAKKLPKKPCYICTVCHTGFAERDMLQNHMGTAHSDMFKFPCRHCGKRFGKKIQRNKHETIHDETRFKGEPAFACDQCDKKYHLKVSLQSHVKKVHLGKVFKKRRYRSTVPILQHHSIGVRAPPKERVKKVYQCPKCDLKFDMRCVMLKHMRVHTDERLYSCKICGQTFKNGASVLSHMRNVHNNPTDGPRPLRPKFMSGQPCPCTVCGKVFYIPSQLRRHMWRHTGVKPHECNICGFRFLTASDLKSHQQQRHFHNKLLQFKCIICGKEFRSFSTFDKHRKCHNYILYRTDKEKAFGCSLCEKPWFTRGEAAVCTVFGHDPSTLLKQMFRFKCSECPSERFGYHSMTALRKHWNSDHPDLPLPTKYRVGMYDGNGNLKPDEDVLPKVQIPKLESRKLKETGIPPMELDYPLFVEFDLVQVDEELLKRKRKGRKKIEKNPTERLQCSICPMTFATASNLKRHMEKNSHINQCGTFECGDCDKVFHKATQLTLHKKKIHDVSSERGWGNYKTFECNECDKIFRKASQLKLHKKAHNSRNTRPGRPRKNKSKSGIKTESPKPGEEIVDPTSGGSEGLHKCEFCGNFFPSQKEARCHELQHIAKANNISGKSDLKIAGGKITVNVNDKDAILSLLGSKVLKVQLKKVF